MAIMAKWLSKNWEVSRKKIAVLSGLSASRKLKTDTNNDKAGSSPTNVRGFELQTFSFDFTLGDVAGSDPRAEWESWESLVGQSAPFFLADKRFGPERMQLTEVSIGDMVLDDFGRIRQAKFSVSFSEDAAEASAKKASTKSTASGKTAAPAGLSTYAELGLQSSAASVGPSTADKAAMKPDNVQLTR